MKDDTPVVVTIQCATYNHVSYIRECLDGFVMQKTTFPFEAVVHDDVSTDGTAGIIREYAEKYPDIIKPIIEKENQYSKRDGSLQRIMDEASHGKYIACCEGDDYWTDPYKLQKQVNFLETHPDYGMCYTKVRTWKNGVIIGVYGTSDTSFAGFIRCSNFPVLTRMYRRSIYENYLNDIKPEEKKWLMGDYPLALYFIVNSRVGFIDEITGVYRILPESASHSQNIDYRFKFYDSADEVRLFFVDRYVSDEFEKKKYHKEIKQQEVIYKVMQYLFFKKQKEARSFYLTRRLDLNIFVNVKLNIRTSSLVMNRLMDMIKKVKDKIYEKKD